MNEAITVGAVLWVVGGAIVLFCVLAVIYAILKAIGDGFSH